MTTATTSSRPRGAARREALLQAVLTIIGDTGADAVTHRRVAEVAELPLASTTYWFQSKEHLLTDALQYAAQRDVARLQALADALPADAPVAPSDVVAVLVDPVEAASPTARGHLVTSYALLLEAARRPELQQLSRDWSEAYVATCAALLARAGSSAPRDDARLLVAAADGLLIDQLAAGQSGELQGPLVRLARALLAQEPS